ncbi:lamin tail domain-containing protein, partial [Bacteroidia bacterium]|nr:lamin tail domain-containing protein [Bacteroidia bacterium]
GVDWIDRDWSNRNIYTWSKGNNGRPLYDKILRNSMFRERYTVLLNKAIKEYYNVAALSPKVYALKTLITQAAIEDTFRIKDYGYTVSDFNNSFGYFSKDHVKFGLVDFITRRATSATSQLGDIENVGVTAFAYATHIDYDNDSVTFSLIAKSENKSKPIRLQYIWDFQSAIWYDTLDLVLEENGMYSLTIAWPDQFKTLSFVFEMEDELGKKNNYPSCNMIELEKVRTGIGLYINEILADNANGMQDEEGKNEDWIELYYNGSSSINLKGYYLTDDITNPYKFPLPEITLESGGFTLIWADSDEQDGVNHANFKLSKDGEDLALFNEDGILVDRILFGSQSEDVSFGRKTDGDSEWIYFGTTTPNSPNDGTVGLYESKKPDILVYPNPTNGIISIACPNPYTYTLYSSDAKAILTGSMEGSINLRDFPDGLYVLQLLSDGQLSTIKIVLLR